MSIQAAQLVVSVVADTKNAEDGLGKINQTVKDTGGFFKNALSNAVSFAAGLGIFSMVSSGLGMVRDGFREVIQASIDGEDVMAQTEAVITSTGGAAGWTAEGVNELAMNLQGMTRYADDVTQSGQNMLLTFTNIKDDVFPEATMTMLDMSTALGQSVKNSAIQLGKALNDPIAGITALQRVGVTFDQKQKDLIATYMAHGDIAKAQSVILQELQKEFGGSAKAAGQTFAGQLEILKNQFGVLQGEIGDAVIPVLTQLLPHINQLVQWVGLQLPIAIETATNLFNTYLQPTLLAVWEKFQLLWNVVDIVSSQFTMKLLPPLERIGGIIWGVVKPALDAFGSAIDTFDYSGDSGSLDMLYGAFDNLAMVLTIVGDILQNNIIPTVSNVVSWFGDRMMPIILKLSAIVGDFLRPVIEQAGQAFQEILPHVQNIINNLAFLGPIIEFLASVFATVFTIGIGIASIALQGLIGAFKGLMVFLDGVVLFIKGFFDIVIGIFTLDGDRIKSGVLNMAEGVGKAFEGMKQTVIGLVKGLWDGVVNFFQTLWDRLVGHSIVPDMINAIIMWFGKLPIMVADKLGSMLQQGIGKFTEFKDKAFAFGRDMIARIGDGIMGAAGSLRDKIGNAVGGAWEGAKSTLRGWGVPGLASGTNFANEGWHWVGENGPELAYMPRGAQVVPNQQSMQMARSGGGTSSGGGGTAYLQIDGQTIARIIMPFITNEIRQAVGVRQ